MENINDTLSKIDIDKICLDENLKKLIQDLMNEIEKLMKKMYLLTKLGKK